MQVLVNKKITSFLKKTFLLVPFFLFLTIESNSYLYAKTPAFIQAEYVQYQGTNLFLIWITPEKKWYFYGPNLSPKIGLPTQITAKLKNGKKLPVFYPPTEAKKDYFQPNLTVAAYTKKTPFFIKIPSQAKNKELTVKIKLLLCSPSSCYPLNTELHFFLTHPKTVKNPIWKEKWEKASLKKIDFSKKEFALPSLEVKSLGKAIIFGILAGLLLNLMPCVLPVIGLKLRSFQSLSKEETTKLKKHNLSFIAGIFAYFISIGSFLAYSKLNWGEIFQNPLFVLLTLFLLFLLALSIFDFFQLPIINPQINSKHPLLEAFFTGFFITLLATPCSGPLLGGVLAWSLLNSPFIILIVFLSIALGLSLPYIFIFFYPQLIKFFPKTSKFNLILEKIIGFLLLFTCIYILTLLPEKYYIRILITLTILTFLVWLKKEIDFTKKVLTYLYRLVIMGFLIFSIFWIYNIPESQSIWINYQKDIFLNKLGKENILVDFTANWCPTCKFLEQTVLTDDFLSKLKSQYNLTLIKVDLSQENKEGEDFLNSLNSKSIPLLAFFPKDTPNNPIIFRDIFTQNLISKVIKEKIHP